MNKNYRISPYSTLHVFLESLRLPAYFTRGYRHVDEDITDELEKKNPICFHRLSISNFRNFFDNNVPMKYMKFNEFRKYSNIFHIKQGTIDIGKLENENLEDILKLSIENMHEINETHLEQLKDVDLHNFGKAIACIRALFSLEFSFENQYIKKIPGDMKIYEIEKFLWILKFTDNRFHPSKDLTMAFIKKIYDINNINDIYDIITYIKNIPEIVNVTPKQILEWNKLCKRVLNDDFLYFKDEHHEINISGIQYISIEE